MFRYEIPALLAGAAVLMRGLSLQADDGAAPTVVQAPTMTLVATSTADYGEQQFVSLTIEVSNPNDASILYTGYLPESFDPATPEGAMSPFYRIETQCAGEWVEYPIGWCGTGMGSVELKPHSTSTFGVAVPDGDWDAVKIEFGHSPDWSDDVHATTTTWSTIYTREEILAQQ